MKSSKLSEQARVKRRSDIMANREAIRRAHAQRRISYIKYTTTRFSTHCSARQEARYRRQWAAGQIKMGVVTSSIAEPAKAARKPRAKKTA